jgi:SAM-dependent methyltransferase
VGVGVTRKAPRAVSKDRELEAGTSAHYEDPAYYTKTYRTRVEDVRYYVDLAVERRASVLEYGCGNGRISIPLARAGVNVTGVDLSAPMLDDFSRRLALQPSEVRRRVSMRRGDMRELRLRGRYDLVICPFNAFLHLYHFLDVERFLARVTAHLAARGELVFDVSIPDASELARDPKRAYSAPRFRYPDGDGDGQMVRYSERFDYDKVRQILFVAMEFAPLSGEEGWMTPLAHRQFFPQELEALLHYNGFEITARYGDFFRSPLDNSAGLLVVHARRRRRRSKRA